MNFTLKNVDLTKAQPSLKHEYVIEREWNLTEKPVSVICKHLRAGEATQFARNTAEGATYFDLREMFKKKVIEIKNLTVTDEHGHSKEITTAEQLLELPSDSGLTDIVVDVTSHLIGANKLTEDEIKNSESDTSASE